MAELLLFVKRSENAGSSFEDGDIICACNNLRIKSVHAHHICHKNNFVFSQKGLRDSSSLLAQYYELIMQYKFVRLDFNRVKRINLFNKQEDILSNKPNASGEYIDVNAFLKRRVKHARHLIFGEPDNEVWYGGHKNLTDKAIDNVWLKIESMTSERKINHTKWPFSDHELKQHLAVSIDDFSELERAAYESPLFNASGIIVKKRDYGVSWKNIDGISESDILNKNKKVDVRNSVMLNKNNQIIKKT